MKKIAIINQKGGVGKTTSVIELAASLHDLGKRVLIIDFDQQCNLTQYNGIETDKKSIYDVICGKLPALDAIQKCAKYDIIAGSEKLSKADREFIDHDDIYLLSDTIDIVSEQYDYIFIDNNPARNILLTMAFVAADYIIAPTECDDGGISGVITTYKDLNKLRESRNQLSHAEILGIILTKFEKTSMHSMALETLVEFIDEKMKEKPTLYTVRKSIAASEAKKMNQSLQEFKKYSTVAVDYRKIANDIVEKENGGQ